MKEITNTVYYQNQNNKSFNFVIIGTVKHDSKKSALDFLEEYMAKDKNKISDINTIHIFAENP